MPEPASYLLRAATAELLRQVEGLPAGLVHWQPGPGVWTVMDILCHVQEFIPYWTTQTRQVIEGAATPWGRTHTDADRLAAVTNTAARSLQAVCQGIAAAAGQSATALDGWTPAQMSTQAPSRNPRWGTQPASFIVQHLLIEHIQKHTGQVLRNAQQYRAQAQGALMSEFLFPPPAVAALPVRGRSDLYPIHRIFCVGRNYEAHAREMGVAADREAPFYFTKAACHYTPSGSRVPYPPGTSSYHYEMELVAAIGKPAFRVDEAHALDYVLGYACGLDMTRRDLQTAAKEKQRPWDLGKDVEQSAVAAELALASETGHPSQGRIELRVNGVTKQSADLSSMIHGVPAVVAHLSRYYHLRPGDLIFTGTPEGVGAAKPGDLLEGSIEGVGAIRLELTEPE